MSNSITSFEQLPAIATAYHVRVQSFKITSLKGIDKWTNLTQADFLKCPKLTDYSALKNLKKLGTVHVHDDHYNAVYKLFEGGKTEVYGGENEVGGC